MGKQATRINMRQETFLVRRVITFDEVHMTNGGIRWNVTVADQGRPPFISRWFNVPSPASDFYEGFKKEGVEDGNNQ